MGTNTPIILLDDHASDTGQRCRNLLIADLEVHVFGELRLFRIGVRDHSARLSDLVPMARSLVSKIYQIVREKVVGSGVGVPCQKGCSSCCYHLICLSVPEVFRLMEEIMVMQSEERQHIEASCKAIADAMVGRLPGSGLAAREYYHQLIDALEWYLGQGIPCPFLMNDLCTIYRQRPIVCREHLMTGPSSPCQVRHSSVAHKIDLPVSIPTVLTELSMEVDSGRPETIPLPCIFGWYKQNLPRHKSSWPASFLVERFVRIAVRSQRQLLMSQIGETQSYDVGG